MHFSNATRCHANIFQKFKFKSYPVIDRLQIGYLHNNVTIMRITIINNTFATNFPLDGVSE